MSSIAVNLPESVIKQAMTITGKKTARAAVIAALSGDHIPNKATLASLRSQERGRTFDDPNAAIAYLRGRYAR